MAPPGDHSNDPAGSQALPGPGKWSGGRRLKPHPHSLTPSPPPSTQASTEICCPHLCHLGTCPHHVRPAALLCDTGAGQVWPSQCAKLSSGPFPCAGCTGSATCSPPHEISNQPSFLRQWNSTATGVVGVRAEEQSNLPEPACCLPALKEWARSRGRAGLQEEEM